MNINSISFIFVFFPIVFLIYYLCSSKFKKWVLLGSSLVFYAWGEPCYFVLLIIYAVINWIASKLICKVKHKKTILIMTVILNISGLLLFKYLPTIDKAISIVVPLGMSYYIFKLLSYTIDVYNNKCEHAADVTDIILYASFFPQITAGPIARFDSFKKSLDDMSIEKSEIRNGLEEYIVGMMEKIVFAESLLLIVNSLKVVENPSIPIAWIITIAYSLQLYLDFCGYSHMAIGLGTMLGIRSTPNFDYPYASKSISDFWRRWHISLSSWFRDYVYIPLGGNRGTLARTCINTMIVFLLTGIWHGSTMNFLLWGLYNGGFVILEKVGLQRLLKRIPNAVQHVYALIVIDIGWVFFANADLNQLRLTFQSLVGTWSNSREQIGGYLSPHMLVSLILSAVLCLPFWGDLEGKIREKPYCRTVVYSLIFVISIMYLWGRGFSPFLYEQF